MPSLFFLIFNVIILFFLFEENGEPGWKVIVPFYGTYTQYKIFYKKSAYFVFLVFEILFFGGIFSLVYLGMLVQGVPSYQITDSQGMFFLSMLALSFIAMIGMIVVEILFRISIAKKYNKGGWFIFGLLIIKHLMLAALAWENRDKLKNNQSKE